MKLEQFEQVLEIVRTGTFSQAARNLFISQPNLSLSIKQLESELGYPLFVRTSEGVVPTDRGRELIQHMSAIQSHYNLLRNRASDPVSHRETFTVVTVNLLRCIPQLVSLVQKYENRAVSFSFLNRATVDEAISMVETCQADIAVLGILEDYRKILLAKLEQRNMEYTILSRNTIHALIGPANEYYHTRSSLSVADLASQTVLTSGDMMRNPLSAFWDPYRSGISCRGRITVDNPYLFFELVGETDAVGLVAGETGPDTGSTPSARESRQDPGTDADSPETRQDPGTDAGFPETRQYPNGYQKHWPDIRCLPITDYSLPCEVGWIRLRRIPLSDAARELLS